MSVLSEEELASIPELPVERLLTLALAHHMIDVGVLEAGDLVHIYVGSRELMLEHEEGTTFLRKLIRGCDQASRLQ